MSGLIEFTSSAIGTVLEVAVVVTAIAVAWILFATIFVATLEVRRYAREHNLSRAYLAGAATGVATFAAKQRVRPTTFATLIVAGFTALVGMGITELTDAVFSSTKTRSGNPPPVLAPLKKSELEMPTKPPQRLPRNAAPWPPFTGVRVELGEQ